MRKVAIGIALLLSGTAIAQTTDTGTSVETDMSVQADTVTETDSMTETDTTADTGMTTGASTMPDATHSTTMHSTTTAANMAPASGAVVEPSNANPERDARGIAVMSDSATVPAGWNGITGAAVGGPLVDPQTGETAAADSYPACSASVTDNCLQTYERGRSAS